VEEVFKNFVVKVVSVVNVVVFKMDFLDIPSRSSPKWWS